MLCFGVPICRLCRGRQYDWISLERHITEGRCPRLKQAAAASLTPDQILAEVEREERRNPPEPPPALTTRAPFLEQHQHILQVSSHALPEHHDQIFTLRDRCALCNQQFKSGLRIKPHWQQIHPAEREHSNKDVSSQLGSLQAIFRTPCQFCGSTAKAGNHRSTQHATKCPAMFQAVALQHLHRSGRLHTHITANRGPSLKQSEKTPMYKSAASPVILQALRAQPTRNGPGEVQLPAEGSASHNQQSDPGYDVPEVPLLSRVSKVNLGNPHNICYVNSSVLAFVHLTLKDTTHRAIKATA